MRPIWCAKNERPAKTYPAIATLPFDSSSPIPRSVIGWHSVLAHCARIGKALEKPRPQIAVPGTIVKATFLASRQTTSRRGPVSPISRNSTARIPSVADNLRRSGRRTLDRDRRPRILDSRSVETKVACTRGFVAPHTPTVGADLCRWRRTGSMGCVQSKATGRPRPPSLCLHVYTASKHL